MEHGCGGKARTNSFGYDDKSSRFLSGGGVGRNQLMNSCIMMPLVERMQKNSDMSGRKQFITYNKRIEVTRGTGERREGEFTLCNTWEIRRTRWRLVRIQKIFMQTSIQ